jgi:CheY-like chemotaxis protein
MALVLVVEDEESFSDALSYMLREEGFEVAVCPTGPDALAAFDRDGADLVLLDLMLLGPPGTELPLSQASRGPPLARMGQPRVPALPCLPPCSSSLGPRTGRTRGNYQGPPLGRCGV